MNATEVTAVVDRVEDGIAVLITEEEAELKLPLSVLPGAGEGDVVHCRFSLDKAAGRDRRQRVEKLLEELKAADED